MSKERLVELLKKAKQREKIDLLFADIDTAIDMLREEEYIADYLIANGVIVPPCKVGDTVYEIIHGEILETKAVGFLVCQDGAILLITKHFFPLSREIGETVFLTREEAEKALEDKKYER